MRELIVRIVMAADAVCTTQFTSGEPVYADLDANVVRRAILDDAGAMLQADALLI